MLYAIGGTSRPEGRGVGEGGVTFWACHINGGGKFFKIPTSGEGEIFYTPELLICLKITDPPPPLGINNEQSLIYAPSLGGLCNYLSFSVTKSLQSGRRKVRRGYKVRET